MAEGMSAELEYVFTATDAVTGTLDNIAAANRTSLDLTNQATVATQQQAQTTQEGSAAVREYTAVTGTEAKAFDEAAAANQRLSAAGERGYAVTERQNIAFMTQQIAVMSTYRGMTRLTSSMHELGLISDSTAAFMQKVNAAVGLVVGGFQLLRGAIQIVTMLRSATVGLAVAETYLSVLRKGPMAVALVGAGIGAAAGIGGYLLGQGQGSSQTVNQTVNFPEGGAGTTEQRAAARDTLEIMGGL
jgi:hypothetical protein